MEYHDVLLTSIYTIQDGAQVIKRVVIPHHYQHVPRPDPECGGCEVFAWVHVELVEFRVLGGMLSSDFFGNLKNCEKDNGESNSGDRRNLFGEKIDDAQRGQGDRDEGEAKGDLDLTDMEVQRHPVFPLAWLLMAEHEDREA